MHIHVASADGEAKFWMEPQVQLAHNYRLKQRDLRVVESLIEEHQNEIRVAWHEHFPG